MLYCAIIYIYIYHVDLSIVFGTVHADRIVVKVKVKQSHYMGLDRP